MSSLAYSSFKAAWHQDQIQMLRDGLHPPPKHLHLILSDLCNHDCHFCAYRISTGFTTEQFIEEKDGVRNHNPNRMIPKDKALEILDDAKASGLLAVQFTGGGEPTVHPHHMEIFRHTLDSGLKCALVTNGCLLRSGWDEVLPRFSWIRVSIDAGSPEVYARVRNISPTMYTRALDNLLSLSNEIRDQGTDCLLGAGYVITRENYQDLVPGVMRLRDSGAAYVRLTAMFSTEFGAYYKGIDEDIRERITVAKDMETADFKVVDLFGNRIDDLEQHAPDYSFCGYQNFTTYIGGNLKVYRCCTTSYTKLGEVGDLSTQRYSEWLKSDRRKLLYKHFNAKSCRVCQFNAQNRVINYMIDPKPTHVEFV